MSAMSPVALLPTYVADPWEALRVVAVRWCDQSGDVTTLTRVAAELATTLQLPADEVHTHLLVAYGEAIAERRNAERESQLLQRMAELRGLHRIIAAANSTLDLDTSMRQVVETVVDVGSVDACAIYLYDRDANELVLRAVAGFDAGLVGQIRMSLGEGVVGAAGQQGQPLMVHDVTHDPDAARGMSPVMAHLRGVLAVPIVLFSDGRFHLGTPKLQGVVTVQTLHPRRFSENEVSFVETVAGELAFFITNAQMFQQADSQLHRKIRELTSLQQVSKRIAEQLRIDELLQLIADKAVDYPLVGTFGHW